MGKFFRCALGLCLLFAGSTARGSTSNQQLIAFGNSLNIDGSGTTFVEFDLATTTNSISDYSVTNGYTLIGSLSTFTLGSGGAVNLIVQNPSSTYQAVELSGRASDNAFLSGGTITASGTIPPGNDFDGPYAFESFGPSIFLSGTTITQTVPGGPAVTSDGSLTMTGGAIYGYEGDDLWIGSGVEAGTFTLAGGILGGNLPGESFAAVGVTPGSTLNLFGSNFTVGGVPLMNGTYTEQAPGPGPTPTYLEVQGTLLSGQSTDFGIYGFFDGGAFTLNVNVGMPPPLPEPVGLGLVSLLGVGMLRRGR